MPPGDGEEGGIRLAAGVHHEVGDQIGIVAGIVGQDVRRLGLFGFGAFLVPEDRGERGRQLTTRVTQVLEPIAEIDGIDRHQCLSHFAAFCFPLGVIWVVACQGAGCREQADIPWLCRLQYGPELGSQAGSVRFEGITQHRKFAGSGLDQAVEEVINLGCIDGEEGKAGVQMFPTLIIGTLYRTH